MRNPKIGITHGDINGIGYEVLLKVLQDSELLDFCTPVIFGNAQVAQATAEHLSLEQVPFHVIADASEAIEGRINLVAVGQDTTPLLQFGQQTEEAVQAEAQSLTAALDASSQKLIDALVTLPGHLDNDENSHALTDFIHRALGSQGEAFDWIINGDIRSLQLHHMDVSTELGEGLASEAFMSHIVSISQSLRQDFGIMRPRMAVISSVDKIRQDIAALHEEGILVFGPFDAQQFTEGAWHLHYDGNLFLNADEARHQVLQGCEAEQTIGYISGLSLVLTYPMQSIGYDIAGQGLADPSPLRHAIYAAIDILRSRIRYRQATHHPLERQWVPRGRDDFKLDLTKED